MEERTQSGCESSTNSRESVLELNIKKTRDLSQRNSGPTTFHRECQQFDKTGIKSDGCQAAPVEAVSAEMKCL